MLGVQFRPEDGQKHLVQNNLVLIRKYVIDAEESTILLSEASNSVSEIPNVLTFINDGPGNVFFN